MIKIYNSSEISIDEILERSEQTIDVEGIVTDIIKNVRENGDKALVEYSKKFDGAVDDILEMVDLKEFGKRKTTELSGGQKQRVAIARALIKEPEIIVADEPTGALDSATGIQVFDTLKKLAQEKLVIVVSHDREFAEIYGDRIIEMKDGVII